MYFKMSNSGNRGTEEILQENKVIKVGKSGDYNEPKKNRIAKIIGKERNIVAAYRL